MTMADRSATAPTKNWTNGDKTFMLQTTTPGRSVRRRCDSSRCTLKAHVFATGYHNPGQVKDNPSPDQGSSPGFERFFLIPWRGHATCECRVHCPLVSVLIHRG